MATILYAWELGGGLGHILRFAPLARKLAGRGHRVVAALRELKRVELAFDRAHVEYIPAPFLAWKVPDPIEPVRTYADLLHNVGFAHIEDLRILTRAWQTIFALARPDVVLCDHSPTALLAASLEGIPSATIGTGFCCPPCNAETLPNLRPWLRDDVPNSVATENRVLANINALRANHGQSPWERLGELYSSAADTFLTTFAELDHFAPRTDARYLGVWESEQGRAFEWPSGNGPRVFLYSHRFPARDWLLEHLLRRGYPTVVYTHDLPRDVANRLSGPTMLVSDAPLDTRHAAAECDIAILNSGHNSCAQFLLAGKPLLLLPIALEQGLLTRRLTSQDLAVSAPPDSPPAIAAALDELIIKNCYRAAACAFAEKYASYDPEVAQDGIVERLERLAECGMKAM